METSLPDTHDCLMHAYDRQPVSFVRGEGARLWDTNGVEYLDAIAGVAVTNLGHAHPEVSAVIADQSSLLLHTSNVFNIPWQRCLGAQLAGLTGMERTFFCSSSAEANETALKLARLHANRKRLQNPQVIVMENSFHGRTFATMAATGNPAVHRGFEPLMSGFVRVPFNDIEAVERVAATNPGISAILVEAVQGEGGVHVASPAYLQRLRRFCDSHDWLLMMDEIQTGMGRTGTWFGYQQAGVVPDVITLAKGLGNGFPIGACLARAQAARLFSPGSHGSTFGGNPLACRVGCTVIDIMTRDDLPARAGYLGRRLLDGLRSELKDVSGIRAIRGQGLMVGIEMAQPCESLVGRALKEERLLITVTRGKTIRILPPLVCSANQIDDMAVRLGRLLRKSPNNG